MTVQAGQHTRRWCPVSAEIVIPRESIQANMVLWDEDNARRTPHQIWGNADGVRIAWIVDELPAGWTRRYQLRQLDAPVAPAADGVRLKESNNHTVEVAVGATHFTTYNYGAQVVRPYLYPVYVAPDVGITRNWPMLPEAERETNDHPHHKGMYTAQGEVNGVDNWSEAEGHGYQVHRSFRSVYSGAVAGGFVEELDWTDANRKPVMAETRRIIFYDTPQGLRIIDYGVELSAAYGPVTLGDTKEAGLLSIRVASSMDGNRPDGGRIQNSFGGTGEAETWGKRAHWCDYSGPVEGRWYGVCVMDHPDNPRHPTYWHVRDYGLMTANCFGVHHFTGNEANREDMHIDEGSSRSWRFRVVVHTREGRHQDLMDRYQDFANPPIVEID
jgi:hypothetical protein